MSGKPAPAKPAPPPKKKIGPVDEQTAEIGGGALAVLIIGGAALAMRSRKRRREDEEAWNYDSTELTLDENAHATSESEPAVMEPPVVLPSPSAFAWGNESRQETSRSDCEDKETWMERAKCGPTEDNPSMSLKKRVKRAAFFEQREREVAEGEAVPVDPDAGLPESMDEDRFERA